MKTKHIHIKSDVDLQKSIVNKVYSQINFKTKGVKLLMLSKLVLGLILTATSYSIIINTNSLSLLVLAYVFYGISLVFWAFNFAHDFAHGTISNNKTINKIGISIIFNLLGAQASSWKNRHLFEHHHAPNVAHLDPDIEINGIFRMTPKCEQKWFHKYQHIYALVAYSSYSLFWIFIKDIQKHLVNLNKTEFTKIFAFWFMKAFYLFTTIGLPLLISTHSFSFILIGFISMHIIQSWLILFTFLITHHVESTSYPSINENGEINKSWVLNQIESSNDFAPFSGLANFIFGGFNNHIAHHLFPNIHSIYYPQINRILYPELIKQGIKPNYSSYLGGIISHLKNLRHLGGFNSKSMGRSDLI